MANIKIVGDAAVITSTLSVEDIQTLKKYRPEALVLKGGEDGKEPIFAIDVNAGSGSVSNYGITFGGVTRDEDKKANLTLVLKGITGDVKEYVADKYGTALDYLNQLEINLPEVLADVSERKARIMANIQVDA